MGTNSEKEEAWAQYLTNRDWGARGALVESEDCYTHEEIQLTFLFFKIIKPAPRLFTYSSPCDCNVLRVHGTPY